MDYYKDYQELFEGAVLWFTGYDQTNLGFPILPAGVTVTPNGTWSNNLNLGNNKEILTFTSSNLNRIVLTDNESWNFGSGNFSICCWIRWTHKTNYAQGIVTQRYKYNSNIALDVYIESTSKMRTFAYACSSNPRIGYEDISAYPFNEWHYICFIRNGDVGYQYNNGVYMGGETTSGFVQCNSTRPLVIGALEASGIFLGDNHFDGQLKDLIIFKGRALTQPEIITLMRLTEPSNRDITPVMSGVRGVE